MSSIPNKDFYNFIRYTALPDKAWLEAVAGQQQTTVVLIKEANTSTFALLEKILAAVQQDLNMDCLVIAEEKAVAYKDIVQRGQVDRLLVFGWKPAELGLHLTIKPYQLVTFGGVQLLFSHNLAAIAANVYQEKKLLWAQLQQLFK